MFMQFNLYAERFGGETPPWARWKLQQCYFCSDQGSAPCCSTAGADDFMASLGMQRQPGTSDTLFARQQFALTSRAFGVQPIDQVWVSGMCAAGHTCVGSPHLPGATCHLPCAMASCP